MTAAIVAVSTRVTADDAFLLGYLPGVAATTALTLGLVNRASQAADPEGKIARATRMALDAVRAARGEPLAAATRLREVTARAGVEATPVPEGGPEVAAWVAGLRAAAEARIDDDRVAGAFAAGCAAGDVHLEMWLLRTIVYLRLESPQLLRGEADEGVARLDAAIARLAELGVRLDARPEVLGVNDAAGLRVYYDWTRGAAEQLVALARSLMPAPAPPAVAGPATVEEEQLLAEVIARPLDDLPRARFAVLAARRHDPLAELIDVQLTLQELRRGGQAMTVQQARLMREAAALISAHPEWSDAILALGAEDVRFVRGFVEGITLPLDVFMARGAAFYAAAPILHVRLEGVAGRAVELAASPHLVRLRSVDLSQNGLGDADVAALAASPHLRGLRWLELGENQITDLGVEILAGSPNLGALAYLGLRLNPCTDPTDDKVGFDDTSFGWEPTAAGRDLEARHGRLAWLHPRGEMWPPGVDQV